MEKNIVIEGHTLAEWWDICYGPTKPGTDFDSVDPQTEPTKPKRKLPDNIIRVDFSKGKTTDH